MKGPRATISDMIDHVDHIASLIGVEHVGLGPDFFPKTNPWRSFINSQGFRGPISFITDDASKVTLGLVERWYSDQEVQMILGGNLLRLLGRVLKS